VIKESEKERYDDEIGRDLMGKSYTHPEKVPDSEMRKEGINLKRRRPKGVRRSTVLFSTEWRGKTALKHIGGRNL